MIVDNTLLLRLGPEFESLSVRGVRGFLSVIIELIYNMIDNICLVKYIFNYFDVKVYIKYFGNNYMSFKL